jgi:hypothetical protein
MATFKKNLINIVILLATISAANATSIDYEKLKEFLNSNDQRLKNVTEISSTNSDNPEILLTKKELDRLVASKLLTNLKKLDLSGHDELTDDHIINLGNNQQSFKRLLAIDLSDCPNITVKSLESIRDSKTIGLIRNLPQISARYGCPASSIRVSIGGKTKITRQEKEKKYISEPFAIEYRLPTGEISPTFRPVKNGMKMLDIEY